MSDDLHKTYLVQLLTETREELTRADQKANILLAVVGLLTASTITTLGQIKASPLSLNEIGLWLSLAAIIFVFISIASLALAIYPRVRRTSGSRLYYFADIAAFSGTDTELADFTRSDAVDTVTRDVVELRALSKTVSKKYTLIRLSLWAAGVAVVTAVIGIVLGWPH